MKYLFVLSKYGDDIQTNGLVLSSVIHEMLKDGNEVVCLSESDTIKAYDYQGVQVFTIKQGLHSTLLKKKKLLGRILEVLLECVHYFSYPSYDKLAEKRMYHRICELNQRHHFDCIYAIYRKYTNVGAVLKFKKRYPACKCGVLFFDLLEAVRPRLFTKHHYSMICRKQYRRIGNIADKVFVPNDGKYEYWDLLPESKREILYYPGFLRRRNIRAAGSRTAGKGKKIVMIFAGTLNTTYRNPTPLFEALKELKALGYKVTLKLYVKGNCSSLIEKAKTGMHLDIIQNEMIDKEQLLTEYQYADVLINLSNHMIKATPSKVFELLSTGKPVLNFVFDKDDSTKAYFDQYIMAHSIFAYEDIAGQMKSLDAFLENAHDLTEEEYSVVESRFENYTPYQVYQSIRHM